ncbi:MAG: hypothetical protein BRD37_02990 [Bacteroidetes bacterium QH_8_67_23]|nr:MAG: hypothetical protein BRD38_00610 [Bacteroidetes bacterium QH_9_67_14]PSQ78380.1 MAG: hypothetical protein BRD37_02990 [Bacteroidetes bacterium QH_8_67_23]
MSDSSSPSSPRRAPRHEDGSDDDPSTWRTALGDAGPYLGLGLQIALTMALYVGAGLGLDLLLDTLPWLTMLGALVGLGTVLYQVVRVADELGKRDEQREREDRSKGA